MCTTVLSYSIVYAMYTMLPWFAGEHNHRGRRDVPSRTPAAGPHASHGHRRRQASAVVRRSVRARRHMSVYQHDRGDEDGGPERIRRLLLRRRSDYLPRQRLLLRMRAAREATAHRGDVYERAHAHDRRVVVPLHVPERRRKRVHAVELHRHRRRSQRAVLRRQRDVPAAVAVRSRRGRVRLHCSFLHCPSPGSQIARRRPDLRVRILHGVPLPALLHRPDGRLLHSEYKKGVNEKPKPGEGEKDDAVVETSDVREAVGEVVTGSYRPDILGGVCWEGAINFRRMVLVLMFTFVNDILLKHLALSGGCFVILLFHLRAMPFKQRFSNIFESVSLSLLLVISGTNLVKSAFYHSQTIPRGQAYIVMVVFEWIEAVALGILPITLIALLFITLIFKTGRRVFRSEQKNTCSTSLRSIESREACFRLAGSHSKQHRRHDDTSPGKRRSSQSHHHHVRRRDHGVTSHVKRASDHRRSNHKIRSREDANDAWGRDVSGRSRYDEKRYDDFYSRISIHSPNRNRTGFSGYNMYTPHHAC